MIPFKVAKSYRMPFGKYKGQTLDDIASTDDGLRYLDWLAGEDIRGPLKDALEAYLDDESISTELETL